MIANLVNQLQTVVNEGANNLNVYPLNGMTFVGSRSIALWFAAAPTASLRRLRRYAASDGSVQ